MVGTNLSHEDYLKLAKCDDVKVLSEDEAKALINKQFGFEFSQIEIIARVDKWELDESKKKWEHTADYIRVPLYDATDWNYIRFNVKGYQYEYINGELYFYED